MVFSKKTKEDSKSSIFFEINTQNFSKLFIKHSIDTVQRSGSLTLKSIAASNQSDF